MNLGQIISLLWKYRTQIAWLLKLVEGWIQSGVEWPEVQRRLKAFDEAGKTADEKGDTSAIENVFRNPGSQ